MSNHLYEENKRLKRENEGLRESLRQKVDAERLPNMLEGCLIAFLHGNAAFDICATNIGAFQGWSIRFRVDPPPGLPKQPSDASQP